MATSNPLLADDFGDNNPGSTTCTTMALSDCTNLHTNNPNTVQEEGTAKCDKNANIPSASSFTKNDPPPKNVQPCFDEDALAAKNNHHQEKEANDGLYWRNMFLALQNERVTAAEEQLYALQAEMPQREQALKNYAMYLEEEMKSYKTKQQKLEEEAMNLKLQVELQSAEVNKKQKEIEQYRMLTALTFSTENSAKNDNNMMDVETTEATRIVNCTVENKVRNTCAQFRISPVDTGINGANENNAISSTENNKNEPIIMLSRYEPIHGCDTLPSFLQSAIEFETSDCPSLLRNILKGVFPDEE